MQDRSTLLGRFAGRLLDLRISVKLTLIIVMFAVIVFGIVALNYLGMSLLSGVRAYVGGEGLWSKAQKDAVYFLRRYAENGNPANHEKYAQFMAVPLGDRKARLELEKQDPDWPRVIEGLSEGRNHPEDHAMMITLFRRFAWLPYIRDAIAIWGEGDHKLLELEQVGREVHEGIASGQLSPERRNELVARIDELNEALTVLEDNFSYKLGEASRWVKFVLTLALFGISVLFLAIGVVIAAMMSRHMSRQIEALRESAGRIAEGDYTRPIEVRGRDEIGDLARSFRSMAEHRQRAEAALAQRADELRIAYEKLVEAERLKEMFFANVSHELRTPLTLILGPVRKWLGDERTVPEQHQDFEVVERNARLLLKHVNDLLDISKLEAGQMHAEYVQADLAQIVRLVGSHFEVLAAERNIRYAIDAPGSLTAQLDSEKVQRILLNLLSNAFKFTPDGGAVRLAAAVAGDHAVLIVQDTGPGIPPHLREAVFERFRQVDGGSNRRFGGTGLGLSIVRQFVNLHGGRIAVEDAPGGGALFRVELPLRAPAGKEVQSRGEGQTPPGIEAIEELRTYVPPRERLAVPPGGAAPLVLVIEDNPDMNGFIAGALRREYQVVQAFDGEQGLAKAIDLRPDLILTDVMMPRMSGDQLVRELRERGELDGVPIVLLTAKADDALRVRLLREGAQDYLNKPFSTEELMARVAALLAERRRSLSEVVRREQQLSLLIDSLPALIAYIDAGQRYQFNNQTYAAWFGRKPAELRGLHIRDVLGEKVYESVRPQVERALAGTPVRYETDLVDADGAVRHVDASYVPHLGPDGKVIGAYVLAHDATERVRIMNELKRHREHLSQLVSERTEELRSSMVALRRSERLAALGTLAAGTAHEINNPLNGVMLASEMGLRKVKDRYAQELFETIRDEAERGGRIVRGMLKFAREEKTEKASEDLNEIVRRAADLGRATGRGHIRVEIDTTSEPLPALVNRTEIEQVLLNLIHNAYEASSNGVHIQIRTERRDERARITVADDGPGIPEDVLPHIFEPFYTTKRNRGGTGLGLSITHGIIAEHGGEIRVRSTPGSGTTFEIELPVAAQGQAPASG